MAITPGAKCSERVSGEGQWGAFNQHRCRKDAIIERNGIPYCKIHDPEYIKAKTKERTAKWQAQRDAESNQRKLETTAAQACVSVNPQNPLAVADSIGEMVKALEAFDAYLSTNSPANIPLKKIAADKLEAILTKVHKVKGE